MKKEGIVDFFIEGAPTEEDFLQAVSQHENTGGCIAVFDGE